MATANISGLVSGLDTASIVDQLMQVEAQPQTALKTSLSAQQTKLKSLQDLNSKIAALGAQAKDLTTATAWKPLTVTSSSPGVTVTATSGTSAGSFDVGVVATAVSHRLSFSSSATGTTHVTGASNQVVVTVGGTSQTLNTDGTLNGAGTGVRASTIHLDDGSERLVVQSATSGAAGAFTLTAADGSDLLGGAAVQQGQDAAITIGSDTLHSATNTFAGVLSGVSLTISAAAVGTTAQVQVSPDTAGIQGKIKGLVDSVNAALDAIDQLTAYDPVTKKSGVLAGDATARSLRSGLLETVYPGDGSTLAKLGVQTDRYGKLVFDADAFDTAYAADPGGVATALGTGSTTSFAARVNRVAPSASDPYSGSLTGAITGKNSTIAQLQGSIEDWDTRLALRRSTLNQQFTALETALNQMQSQSTWLSGQISSLSSGS